MAKRFTDTEQWDRPWFRGLPTKYKLLWRFIVDRCDIAGVWYVDMGLASFFTGEQLDRVEAEFLFQKQIEISADRWLIKGFISFQYGHLSPENKLYRNVMSKLEQFKEGASMPHISPIYGVKDKEKEKDKDIAVSADRSAFETSFEQFWTAYPKRRSKGDALKAWRALKPSKELTERILRSLQIAKRSTDWVKEGGQFIPYPGTWLRSQGWEDEVQAPGTQNTAMDPSVVAALRADTERRMQIEWERQQARKQQLAQA